MADPNKPPPIVRTSTAQPQDGGDDFDKLLLDQDAEDQRQLELYEAQEQTKKLSALFANRVYIQPDGKHLRVSFGERVGDEDRYHTSVVIPLDEAHQIGDLITRMSAAGLAAMFEQYRQVFAADSLKKPGNV